MNRFRVNLHPAFFGDNLSEAPKEQENKEVVQVVKLEQDVIDKADTKIPGSEELDNFAFRFMSGVNNGEIQIDQRKNREYHERFAKRTAEKKGDKTYEQIWNTSITTGFGWLITELTSKGYFSSKSDKDGEIAKIKGLYKDEVNSQFMTNVLESTDENFNKIKDDLFSRSSKDSPAQKIFDMLTRERTYTEGYETIVLDGIDDGKDENLSDRQNIKFLSKELPNYLWNLKKNPGLLKTLNRLPFISVKIDKPSEEDRNAIRDFLRVSSKIDGEGAVILLNAFKTNSLNELSTKEDYKRYFNGKIKFKKEKESNWDDLVNVGKFYFKTQLENNGVKDQHAIYLSILKVIETEGGVKPAVEKFKDLIDGTKKEKKKEKREGYDNGETLKRENKDLYDLATKLRISDFTSATRLQRKDRPYFEGLKNNPEKILANLNNDRVIDARDTITGGSKTGSQFIEVFNQVGKDTALKNLFERAKLENKALGLLLDEAVFTEAEITGGNKKLILLLQNIINKPGEDLLTLLGDKTRVEYDMDRLLEAQKKSEEYAKDMAGKIDLLYLKSQGLENLPTPEELQSGLAATLYSEYSKGLGLGSKISFDEWVKGLSMNTGFQVRDDKSLVLGIGLSYKKEIDLGKGWSTTPMFSAGGFIPLGYGRPELGGSLGFNNEIAKRWITEKGVAQKMGLNAGVTVMNTGTVILSAGINWYRDKLAGIESAEQKKREEMRELVKSILNEYGQKVYDSTGIKTPSLDLSNGGKLMKEIIKSKAVAEEVPADKIDDVVNGTMRLLLPYQGAQFVANPKIRDMIAAGVADQYAMAWAEDRKAHISDATYLSGASLGAFWVVGAPLVGIYAGMQRTRNNVDGYADRWGFEYNLDHQYEGGRNQQLVDNFNQEAGFRGNDVLKVSEVDGKKYIQIPKNLAFRVHVNEKLKGNMKRDNEGNILLHIQTPMASKKRVGSATHGSEIIIGGRKGENFTKLDLVQDDWFTNGEIKATEILNLGEGIRTYSADVINKALVELKTRFPQGDKIQNFTIDDAKMKQLVEASNKINEETPPHKVKLSVDTDNTGKLVISDPVKGDEGRGLEIEYKAKFEMFDAKAKLLADRVYKRAASLTDPTGLNRVKHPLGAKHPDYENFVNNLMGLNGTTKNLEAAKQALQKILGTVNQSYRNNKLSIAPQDWPTDPKALEQALMSINNLFARSGKVHGAGTERIGDVEHNKYNFTMKMGKIIEEREGQIGGTLEERINANNPKVKKAYSHLMSATKRHRETHRQYFDVLSSKAAHLNNAVGFNLGDKFNPENPLFNPEIYEKTVNLNDLDNSIFSEADRKVLHERAMRNFVSNSALITPILKALGLEGATVTPGNFENGQLTLDISKENSKKQITLKADMKFGYFTQCVNHTIILDNISAESSDGTSVQFNSGVWENGVYKEGDKTTINSAINVEVGGAVVSRAEGAQQDATTNQETGNSPLNNGNGSTDQSTHTSGGNFGDGSSDGRGGGGRG